MSFALGFFIVFIGIVGAYFQGHYSGYMQGREDEWKRAGGQSHRDELL